MSAPSLRNITQTSQREFAPQRYYIFLIYAKKIATECDFFTYTMWNTLIVIFLGRRTLNQ